MIVLRCPKCKSFDVSPMRNSSYSFQCEACKSMLQMYDAEFTIVKDLNQLTKSIRSLNGKVSVAAR